MAGAVVRQVSTSSRASRASRIASVRSIAVRNSQRMLIACLALVALVACGEATHTIGVLDESSTRAGGGTGASAPRGGTNGSASAGAAGGGSASAPMIDAGSTNVDPDCAATALPAVAKRLDFYFMVGTNITIPITGAWGQVTRGVSSYVDDARAIGTGLGVGFFGFSGCDANLYAAPDAPVASEPLPANAQTVKSAFADYMFPVTTILPTSPIGPALEGAVRYARSRSAAFPDQEAAVVLITDGFIDFVCLSTAESISQAAATGLQSGVRTYVVALTSPGNINPIPTDMTIIPLDPVAQAGGTGTARTVDLGNDTEQDFAEMLLAIQRDAQPCEYRLPDGEAFDQLLLAVNDGAGPVPLPRLAGEAACGSNDGVFLDTSTGTPWAVACPTSCGRIKTSGSAPVWLRGCDASSP